MPRKQNICCLICDVNKEKSNRTFFRFPTELELRRKWIDVCIHLKVMRQGDILSGNTRICSDHFRQTDFFGPQNKRLKGTAIPIDYHAYCENCQSSLSEPCEADTAIGTKNKRIYLDGFASDDMIVPEQEKELGRRTQRLIAAKQKRIWALRQALPENLFKLYIVKLYP